jgi:hypothetical protein
MTTVLRVIYLGALVGWVAFTLLYPPWFGRLYTTPLYGQPGDWTDGGAFALAGGSGFERRAPLWDPPGAWHNEAAPVRWPWQSPWQGQHVELSLYALTSYLGVGVLVLGVLLRAAYWLAGRPPDDLVTVAWSVSLALTLAGICILAVAVFTFGYGMTDAVVTTIWALGLVGGGAYGAFAVARRRAGTPPSNPGETRAVRPRAAAGLFWLTVGVVIAVGLTVAAAWIASFFRGPVIGVSELGTPRFARDQGPIDVSAGLGILAAGWLLGGWLLWVRKPWPLAVGLMIGSTILGAVYALQ